MNSRIARHYSRVLASSVALTQWHRKVGLETSLLICSGSGILSRNYSGLTQCKRYEVLQLVLLFKGSDGSSSQPTGLYISKKYFKYEETPFTYLRFKLSRSVLPETCSFDKFPPSKCSFHCCCSSHIMIGQEKSKIQVKCCI